TGVTCKRPAHRRTRGKRASCPGGRVQHLSHGENRGSSPLGSASKINGFCKDGRARPPLKPPFQDGHRLVKSPRAGAFQIGEFIRSTPQHRCAQAVLFLRRSPAKER